MKEKTELNLCKDCLYFKPKGTLGFCKQKTKLVKKNDTCELFATKEATVSLIEEPVEDKKYSKILIKNGKKYFF